MKSSNSLVKFWHCFVFIVLTLGVVALSLRINGGSRARQRVEASMELKCMALALEQASILFPNLVVPTLSNGVSASSLYSLFFEAGFPVKFLEPKPSWDKRKSLVDPWGNDYRFRIEATPASQGTVNGDRRMRIWSIGPNGRDEHGGGDDIIWDSQRGLIEDGSEH